MGILFESHPVGRPVLLAEDFETDSDSIVMKDDVARVRSRRGNRFSRSAINGHGLMEHMGALLTGRGGCSVRRR
jgi:hypothetical protein